MLTNKAGKCTRNSTLFQVGWGDFAAVGVLAIKKLTML